MGTVTKALSLLSYFTPEKPQIGLSELSRLAGQNKATTYRMMAELQACRFVEQVGSERSYRIGTAVLRMASVREASVPLRETAQNIVRDLAIETSETAHFGVLDGTTLTTLNYSYSTTHGTRVTMDDAQILPLHATSSGVAVLAFSSPEFITQILTTKLEPRTPKTITNPQALRNVLDETQKTGVAEYIAGFEADVHSFASPVFDAGQRPIAAIAVAAPMMRVNDQNALHIRRCVFDAAKTLTELTGGFSPHAFERAQ